jgi:hypothetical protein
LGYEYVLGSRYKNFRAISDYPYSFDNSSSPFTKLNLVTDGRLLRYQQRFWAVPLSYKEGETKDQIQLVQILLPG